MHVSTKFKNGNKDTVEIIVSPLCDSFQAEIVYRIGVVVTPYRKKKSMCISTMHREDYAYRQLELRSKERSEYMKAKMLEYVTEEQLQMAVNNAYEALKPVLDNLKFG